ncbi:benenodin family lasso peptide [Govanella unica]|uniref:Benenodin family lasso peptide n=1 Tax=Govanella unica TaxID=2975056 RepID=A0A9X3Z743_9PROT|nr:benenodin family lasso peptide [Govania unica]MDA5193683.1 benenodin family lasso peptide [Govania unica]
MESNAVYEEDRIIDLGAVSEETKGGGAAAAEQDNPLLPLF